MSSYLNAPSGYSHDDLVFNDSFLGSKLNSSIWNTDITNKSLNGAAWNGTSGGGSGLDDDFNAAYFEPSQVGVDNGLTLTAAQAPVKGLSWGSTPYTYPYTSGAVSTYGKFEFDGGYLQISMKEPAGDGAWPSIWLLPGSTSTASSSAYEIDVQEGGALGNPTSGLNYNAHNNFYLSTGSDANTGVNLTAGFHTYGIDWEPGQSITWYLDGTQVGKVVQGQKAWDSATSSYAPISIPNTPMFLMMDLQVANAAAASFHTALDSSTPASMAMQIADVQLYQHAGETVTGSDVPTLVGGGQKINLNSSGSNTVILSNSGNNWDTVTASGGQATLTNAQASIVGGGNALYSDAGSWLSLYQTNGNADVVNGSGSNVILNAAQASTYGGGNRIIATAGSLASLYQTSNNWDTVYGSGGNVNLSSAQASIVGGGDTIDANAGSSMSLYETGGNSDTVNGSGDLVILTAAQASIVGGSDTVYANSGSALSLFQTNNNWDAVYGSNETFSLNASQASFLGGADTINATAGSSMSLYQTGGNWDTAYGSNDLIILTAAQAWIVGGGDTIYGNDASSIGLYDTAGVSDKVEGSSDYVALNSAQASLAGSGDSVWLNGTSSLSLVGTSESLGFGANIGQATVSGFGSSDRIRLSAADWGSFAALQNSGDLTQQGANTIIALNASNEITLVNEQVSALSSTRFVFS